MVTDIASSITDVRIGFDEAYATQGVDPELAAAVVAGVRVLESLGATIVPVRLPDLAPYLAAWPTLCTAEAVAHPYQPRIPPGATSMAPGFAAGLTWGPACRGLPMPAPTTCAPHVMVCCVPGTPLMHSPARRCRHRPFPSRQEALRPMPDGVLAWRVCGSRRPITSMVPPTLSVPCGLSRDGLPLSLCGLSASTSGNHCCVALATPMSKRLSGTRYGHRCESCRVATCWPASVFI